MKTVLKIVFCLSALLLMAVTPSTANEHAITIGAEDAAGLWGRKDGTGCANDIVLAAFKAANLPVTLQVLPYVRAKEDVIQGKLPGGFAMAWEDSFKEKVVFAKEPLYTLVTVGVVRKEDTITRIEDLRPGMVVGTVRGYEYTTIDLAALQKKGIIFEGANSETQNLQKLLSGRVHVALVNLDELNTLNSLVASSKELRSANAARKLKQGFASEPYGAYIGFSTINKNGLIAKAAFEKGFAIIKSNGTLANILAEWKKRRPS